MRLSVRLRLRVRLRRVHKANNLGLDDCKSHRNTSDTEIKGTGPR